VTQCIIFDWRAELRLS